MKIRNKERRQKNDKCIILNGQTKYNFLYLRNGKTLTKILFLNI